MTKWTLTVQVSFDDDNDPRERAAAEVLMGLTFQAQRAFERGQPGRDVEIWCGSDRTDQPPSSTEDTMREVEMDVFGAATIKLGSSIAEEPPCPDLPASDEPLSLHLWRATPTATTRAVCGSCPEQWPDGQPEPKTACTWRDTRRG